MRWLQFVLSFLAVVSMAVAQTKSGSLAGTVVDAQGAAISGAGETVRNMGTNTTFNAKTEMLGAFEMPSLLPARYAVTIEQPARAGGAFSTKSRRAHSSMVAFRADHHAQRDAVQPRIRRAELRQRATHGFGQLGRARSAGIADRGAVHVRGGGFRLHWPTRLRSRFCVRLCAGSRA